MNPAFDGGKFEFIAAQETLDGQFDYSHGEGRYPGVFKFNADRLHPIPVRFMTGEMGLGSPFDMKFIRGIAAYGSGKLQLRVYVDRCPVQINKPDGTLGTYADLEMAETPDPQRVVWLKRGTKGRTVNIEGSGQITHVRSIVVYWDPLRGEEDG